MGEMCTLCGWRGKVMLALRTFVDCECTEGASAVSLLIAMMSRAGVQMSLPE